MLSLVEAFIGFFSRIKGKDATPSTTPSIGLVELNSQRQCAMNKTKNSKVWK